MGQRFQVFIRTYNPAKQLENSFKNYGTEYWNKNRIERDQELRKIERYKQAFGTDEFCVEVFHHSWLYGRASLISGANVLNFIENAGEHDNPFKKNSGMNSIDTVKSIQYVLSMFTNRLAQKIGRCGIEPFRLLNFTDHSISHDFTLGDNNDGILIIDSINSKYCFLNIGGDSTINQLPLLEPVPAERYVKLYYPECPEDSSTANFKGKSDLEITEIYINNKRLNRLFTKPFKEVKVLTTDELRVMFPASYSDRNN